MLIGAHVSPAGGPANAVTRGVERGCRAIQIFNQSPRMWKSREYKADEVEAFHAAMADSPIEALVIHAVYLLNCASEDPELREKSLRALTVALNAGAQLGAVGVVLHPGSALKDGGPVDEALKRAGSVIKEALAESEKCQLLLEDTAGAGGTLGRSFEELATLLELAGGQKRLGICLDSCHLWASGYDVTDPGAVDALVAEVDETIGLDRLRALHVNDSLTALGSNRDRHANILEGEIGEGLGAFLTHPAFQELGAYMEVPGQGDGPDLDEMTKLRELHARWTAKAKPRRRRAPR
jgi:deoxyribonuclease-4